MQGLCLEGYFLYANNPREESVSLSYFTLLKIIKYPLCGTIFCGVLFGLLSRIVPESLCIVVNLPLSENKLMGFATVWSIHFGLYCGLGCGVILGVVRIRKMSKVKVL